MPRTFQDWVHWIELGAGAQWIRRLAVMLAIVLVSGIIAYKQFRGPGTEATLAQAVIGRQLADGQGYTTLVNYPQTAAWVGRGGGQWREQAFPELYSAPLYPAVIGATLMLLPSADRSSFFQYAAPPPAGFLPDYLLLGLNIVLFWITLAAAYHLARRLFDPAIAGLTVLALLLSASLWNAVLSVNGTALAMVLFLALLHVSLTLDRAAAERAFPFGRLILAGMVAGLLFLTDYSSGLALVALLLYAGYRFAGERFRALAALTAGFLLVASPWGTYLISKTGSPVGLAWQEIAQRTDGTASDPSVVRATLAEYGPSLDFVKLAHKGASRLEAVFRERLWTDGLVLFTAFFVVSLLYRFREGRVNRIRSLLLVLVVLLAVGEAFFDSGEGERVVTSYAAPALAIFGLAFCSVLLVSSERLAGFQRWVLLGLIGLQALPLVKDMLEPRGFHFRYPPYYPPLFLDMADEMRWRGGTDRSWMADIPAGAAWYSGQRVWAKPVRMEDFYAIGAEQPMSALMLTSVTLDRPYFSVLARPDETVPSRIGDWSQVYAGLATGRPVPGFPLSQSQKVADNFYVLFDPTTQRYRRK